MKKSLATALSVAAMTATLTLAAASLPAHAAGYPDRPITIVVPYAAGGSNDLVARVLSQRLGQDLGVSVVVDNAPDTSTMGCEPTMRRGTRSRWPSYLIFGLVSLAIEISLLEPRSSV